MIDFSIRRLQRGDERILQKLAVEEADFDLDGRASPTRPLDAAAARSYLADPAVLHWVAVDDQQVLGDLQCIILPLSGGDARELILYDIGVRTRARGHGVGRALLAEMETWMVANGIAEVWVLADNPAAAQFYRACGFSTPDPQPIYMTRRLNIGVKNGDP